MGSLFFGYFNDSLFWVVNRMMGINDVKKQMIVWSVPTTIAWGIGGISVILANLIWGNDGSLFDLVLPVVVMIGIGLYIKAQNKHL
ncbi:GntP family permease, partial [Glaesserella parasuis]